MSTKKNWQGTRLAALVIFSVSSCLALTIVISDDSEFEHKFSELRKTVKLIENYSRVSRLPVHQREILNFLNRLADQIPTNLKARITELKLTSPGKEQFSNKDFGVLIPLLDVPMSKTGDLRLGVEIIELDSTIYALFAIEEIKTSNRILEISDQIKEKAR